VFEYLADDDITELFLRTRDGVRAELVRAAEAWNWEIDNIPRSSTRRRIDNIGEIVDEFHELLHEELARRAQKWLEDMSNYALNAIELTTPLNVERQILIERVFGIVAYKPTMTFPGYGKGKGKERAPPDDAAGRRRRRSYFSPDKTCDTGSLERTSSLNETEVVELLRLVELV